MKGRSKRIANPLILDTRNPHYAAFRSVLEWASTYIPSGNIESGDFSLLFTGHACALPRSTGVRWSARSAFH